MQQVQLSIRNGFLGLIVVTIATSGSLLTACSRNTLSQAQPSIAVTPTVAHPPMHHTSMDLGPADGEFDLRFIDSMIPHHEGAVVMAQDVLQKTQRPELKKLAEEIIKAQEQEIKQMKQWRMTWYPKAPKEPVAWHSSMGHGMTMSAEQIAAMRMQVDLGIADTNFDRRFIEAMIPHHEGAVVMAKDALQKSKRPEMLQLAKGILASQQKEISQMQQWRKAWYGK